jgi:hypothetical protein
MGSGGEFPCNDIVPSHLPPPSPSCHYSTFPQIDPTAHLRPCRPSRLKACPLVSVVHTIPPGTVILCNHWISGEGAREGEGILRRWPVGGGFAFNDNIPSLLLFLPAVLFTVTTTRAPPPELNSQRTSDPAAPSAPSRTEGEAPPPPPTLPPEEDHLAAVEVTGKVQLWTRNKGRRLWTNFPPPIRHLSPSPTPA